MGLALIGASIAVGIGAIIEMTFWSTYRLFAALLAIAGLRVVYGIVSIFAEWTDPRNAKPPASNSDPPPGSG